MRSIVAEQRRFIATGKRGFVVSCFVGRKLSFVVALERRAFIVGGVL
jgi:hypothetical protein